MGRQRIMFKKLMLWLFVVLFIGCAALTTRFYTLGIQSQGMMAPGLISGQLSPCPNKPNCVNSEFSDDADHYTQPISFESLEWPQIQTLLKKAIDKDQGKVKQITENYLSAEYKSGTFGFVDDVEFRFDPAQNLLHLRSASRVGYSDLNANTERVLRIRAHLNALQSK